MSGHYLETMNPEAVDAIGTRPEGLPDIGSTVVYIARPGEGRSGKMEFPAFVMHHEPQGGLYLLVMYAADDFVERPQIRELSDDLPYPAWRHIVGTEPEKFDPSRLNIIRRDLDAVRAKLDETIQGIYGEYVAPGCLMEFLVKFEQELKEVRKAVSAQPKPAGKTKK